MENGGDAAEILQYDGLEQGNRKCFFKKEIEIKYVAWVSLKIEWETYKL